MPYYLGIDGGGTKTTFALGDESSVLATATSGPSNIVRVGEAKTRASLLEGVRQACAAAGIDPGNISHTSVGGSGAGHPELAERVRRFLAEIISSPIDVVGDMQTALEAAFGDQPGVVVNAGTGSFAYGRDRRGQTARAGGWGFAIGDEGSAHWIGRAAVNAILRASDEHERTDPPSAFASAIFKSWGVQSLADLARAANSVPPPDFSALSPAVFASSDPLASDVLTGAGRELARTAHTVIRRLFRGSEPGPVPVAMTGGVFRHASTVREVFYNELRQLDARVEIHPAVVDPVNGALRMARRAAKRA
ncbi:MAG TPA: BadF/BadG/BcrA/BcrD ATPase family protein [Candidatus Acidoferrales bacterium]|nr:BadF/BadG/BcrA/BcrD ATPase family protein [Candidatus Acidoferrales bacterium]